MPKEPIELGLSVERHKHHSESDHQHHAPEVNTGSIQRTDREFGVDSLNRAEQILAIFFVGAMLVGFLALIIFIVFR